MSRYRSILVVFSCVLVCLLLATGAFAQSDTAQISGYVKDATGAMVPNANVTLKHETTGFERQGKTNETGYYVVSNLPPGYYSLTVEAPGFKKYIKTQNKLDANIPATIDAVLEVGAVAETVEVVAEAARLQSETATVGRLIDSQTISNMMLNGRNPLLLALLKPGVRGGSLAGFTYNLTSGGFSINGSRTQDFLITFDGAVAIRTRANGTGIGAADVDTVQEIQILTANYAAEYGRSAGGQVRIITKSGSRDFHGDFYEYFRNNELDANSWSRNRARQDREARKFNQFGYLLSGPAYIPGKLNADRNKLFWLWGQEWVRFRRESTSIQVVPSLLMRQGNFSELLGSNPFFSTPRVVNDPLTGQPFPGNIIPSGRLSSNGLGFLRAYPEPTPGFLQGRSNFIQTRPEPANQRKDTLSLDFQPSERHNFRFRHQNYNWTQLDAFRGGFDRAVTDWSRPNKTASLNYVWTISPTLVNEFLATASVDRVFIGVQREGERFARSKYGINYPYIFPERKEIFDKIPTIDIASFATVDGGPYP
ncbi:MAG: carboxypeptidase regulatory-like domain-containing protein, partial [Gammaproteobacteria bacterium]